MDLLRREMIGPALALCMGVAGAQAGEVTARRMTWAHYVPWLTPDNVSQDPDRWVNAPVYERGDDPFRDEISRAMAAGIDGFFMDIVCYEDSAAFWDLRPFLKAAEGTDFQVAICLDKKVSVEATVRHLVRMLGTYGDHPNAYFEIFNEPHMYNKTDLRNLYADWLKKFPNVPRDHILLDGSGLAWNVPDIADDPRFEGCLFAVHEYTFWNMSITTEQGWKNSFKGKVGKYIDRTVCTEWGGAMSPGEKNGVHYDYQDYNKAPTNYFTAYIRGMSDQLREWEMGSFYWPGLRDGDWYSMTKRSGEGINTKLQIVNQSGVDRMQMAWADTVETTPPQQDPFGGFDADGKAIAGKPAAIPGKIEAENYDLGGSRVSFYDKSSANEGGAYRKDAVDIVALDSADLSKGYALGYTQAGEWLEYTVNIEKTSKFTVEVQMATASEKAGVQLYIDNKAVSDSIIAKQGEDWSNYTAVQTKLGEIAAGEHVLKLQILGDYVNIDWLKFCEGEKCEESVGIRAIRTATPGENASAPRLRVQNNKLFVEKNGRHFDLTGHRIK